MEARRALISFFCLLLVAAPSFLFAYNDTTTHPGLTRDGALFYNSQHPENILTQDQIDILAQGSVDEDLDYRFMRHFYDPVHASGLTFLESANFGRPWSSAKTWGTSGDAENTGFTWNDAVELYRSSKKDEAYYALGHVLHLLEDMTVPDHTRDDPHPPLLDLGSPYESWTKQFGPDSAGAYDATKSEHLSELYFSDIEGAFDVLANYSNSNFFSKDTVNNDVFSSPAISFRSKKVANDGTETVFVYSYLSGESFHPIKLARVVKRFSFASLSFVDGYVLTDPQNEVMREYWNLLKVYAVRGVSGAIALFFSEADSAKIAHFEIQKQPISSPALYFHPAAFATAVVPRQETLRAKGLSLSVFRDARMQPVPPASLVHLVDVESGDPSGAQIRSRVVATLIENEKTKDDTGSVPATSTVPVVDLSGSNDSVAKKEDRGEPLFGPTDFSFAVGSSTVLRRSASPYIVRGFLLVPEGHTVSMEPGVIVKFAPSSGFLVEGDIVAVGSSTRPVVLTSLFDDEFGGDSDGGGVCGASESITCPFPGAWLRLEFASTSRASRIENALLRYGAFGDGLFVPSTLSSFIVEVGGHIDIAHTRIEHGGGHGIRLLHTDSTVVDTTVIDTGRNGLDTSGIEIQGGASTVENSLVDGQNIGISSSGSLGTIRNNDVRHTSFAYLRDGEAADLYENNRGEENLLNGIILGGQLGSIKVRDAVLEKNRLPYVTRFANASVAPGKTLVVAPGVSWKINGEFVTIGGDLRFIGTEAEPVRILSQDDDSDGNDLFSDGPTVEGTSGGPLGLILRSGAHLSVEHAIFSHLSPAIRFEGVDIDLSHVRFEHNGFTISGSGTIVRAEELVFLDNVTESTIDLTH